MYIYKVCKAGNELYLSVLLPLGPVYSCPCAYTSSTLLTLIQLYTYRGFYFVTIIYPVRSLDCTPFPLNYTLLPARLFPRLIPLFSVKFFTHYFYIENLYIFSRNWINWAAHPPSYYSCR